MSLNKITLNLFLSVSPSEPDLKKLENSAQIFNALSDTPGDIEDVDQLLQVKDCFQFAALFLFNVPISISINLSTLQVSFEVASSLNDMMIETHRRRHLAYLMSDQGGLVGNPENMPNLPKQHLSRSARLAAVLLHALLDCIFSLPGRPVTKFWS